MSTKQHQKPHDQQYRHLQTSQQTGYQYFLESEVSRFSFYVSHIFLRTNEPLSSLKHTEVHITRARMICQFQF